MNNPLRNEVTLSLGGEDYSARLTIDSLIKLEDTLGKSILRVAKDLASADIRLGDCASILHLALRGGGNDLSLKDVKKIIESAGLLSVCRATGELLTQTLGDEDADGDEEAKKTPAE